MSSLNCREGLDAQKRQSRPIDWPYVRQVHVSSMPETRAPGHATPCRVWDVLSEVAMGRLALFAGRKATSSVILWL
jgi:hypothetical protein